MIFNKKEFIIPSSYRDYLPELWSSILYDQCRNKEGYVYADLFLDKQRKITLKKITHTDELPNNAIKKMLSQNKCSYCNEELNFKEIRDGDHIVRREMNHLIWTVPCCRSCNSSKGKKDLLEWWINFKGNNITNLSHSVIGVFCRAKYRLLQKHGELDGQIPSMYVTALLQIRTHWEIKF
jgi:hypothetical protein